MELGFFSTNCQWCFNSNVFYFGSVVGNSIPPSYNSMQNFYKFRKCLICSLKSITKLFTPCDKMVPNFKEWSISTLKICIFLIPSLPFPVFLLKSWSAMSSWIWMFVCAVCQRQMFLFLLNNWSICSTAGIAYCVCDKYSYYCSVCWTICHTAGTAQSVCDKYSYYCSVCWTICHTAGIAQSVCDKYSNYCSVCQTICHTAGTAWNVCDKHYTVCDKHSYSCLVYQPLVHFLNSWHCVLCLWLSLYCVCHKHYIVSVTSTTMCVWQTLYYVCDKHYIVCVTHCTVCVTSTTLCVCGKHYIVCVTSTILCMCDKHYVVCVTNTILCVWPALHCECEKHYIVCDKHYIVCDKHYIVCVTNTILCVWPIPARYCQDALHTANIPTNSLETVLHQLLLLIQGVMHTTNNPTNSLETVLHQLLLIMACLYHQQRTDDAQGFQQLVDVLSVLHADHIGLLQGWHKLPGAIVLTVHQAEHLAHQVLHGDEVLLRPPHHGGGDQLLHVVCKGGVVSETLSWVCTQRHQQAWKCVCIHMYMSRCSCRHYSNVHAYTQAQAQTHLHICKNNDAHTFPQRCIHAYMYVCLFKHGFIPLENTHIYMNTSLFE